MFWKSFSMCWIEVYVGVMKYRAWYYRGFLTTYRFYTKTMPIYTSSVMLKR